MTRKISKKEYWECLGLIEIYNSLTSFGLAMEGFKIRKRIEELMNIDPELRDWFLMFLKEKTE